MADRKTMTIGQRLMNKYPNKIPIIIHYKDIQFIELSSDPAPKTSNSNRLLIPDDFTIGYLLILIRRQTKISHTDGLFIFINQILPCTTSIISTVYQEHKNPFDDCLHVIVMKGNTFG